MSQHLPNIHYLDPEVLQRLDDLELVAREAVEGLRSGNHRSPLRGFSTEFAHHRQYAPGDAIRDLDWRLYGRTDRYYTKLYEAETNFDCCLLVDSSRSMTYASDQLSKLEYAKFLAASLAYMVLKQRDSIGLSVFDSKVRAYFPPRSSMNILLELDRLLRSTDPKPKTNIAQQLDETTLLLNRRSVVILISDLFADPDDVLRGLRHLRFAGHNVVVFHTLDPYEISFPFKGAWHFEGLEEEEPLITQPERIRQDYLDSFNNYLETIRSGCVGSGIDYSIVDTSRPLDAVLGEFINERKAAFFGASTGTRS